MKYPVYLASGSGKIAVGEAATKASAIAMVKRLHLSERTPHFYHARLVTGHVDEHRNQQTRWVVGRSLNV